MGSNIINECLINGVQYKCRTCFDPGRTVYFLAGEASNTKTWRDLLKDIAQLQTNEDELLPKTLCCKCQEKLKTSYDFILQIKSVNKTYAQLLANGKDGLQSEYINENYSFNDCLSESAINLPLEQYMPEIKLEQEMVSSFDIDLDRNKLKEENETKVENEDADDSVSETFDEEFISTLEHLEENERSPSESLNEDYNDSEFRNERSSSPSNESADDNISSQPDQQKIPQQPTKFSYDDQIPRHLVLRSITAQSPERTVKIDNVVTSFLCLICKKKFTLLGNCRQHIKNIHNCLENIHKYIEQNIGNAHSDDPMDPNVRRWLFGDRIYSKPTAWRLVQCKLCTTNFKTTKELRKHLESHSDVDTLHQLQLADNIVQYMFPNMHNLNYIKESICKDIRKKQWFKYYTVLNEYSYEMSISDTEVEDLEEEIAERAKKYKCAFCAKGFSYKYQVFPHSRDAHIKDEIPLKCSQCKLEFISIKMYKQHLETHCQNKHKGLLCAHCPGKFIWPENIKNHNCGPIILAASTTSTEDQHQKSFENVINGVSNSGKPKIHCGLCAQSFKNLRHLRQHMPLHADGKTGVDFIDCYYVKQFENLDSINIAKLQKQIQDAYNKSQISRFYQAIDNFGNEMDISDSDTESSTEDTSVEKFYACDLCREVFKKRKYLLNHQHSQHLGAMLPFSCMECQKQFVSIHLLQQHLKRECFNEYRRIAPTCDFCNARFIWPNNMLEHKAIQHQSFGSMPTITKSVETATVEKESWFQQEEVSKNQMIDISNNECMESKKLHSSELKFTMENKISKLFTPTENKFLCPSCRVSFSNNSKLTVHIKLRHSIENPYRLPQACELEREVPVEHIPKAKNKRLCPFCGVYLSGNTSLTLHIRTHTGEKPFKCDFCEMAFIRRGDLIGHRRVHTDERPFKCPHCEKSFKKNYKLTIHIRVHTGERPYQCTFCKKKFGKSEYLKLHLRSHTGERPYKCEICSQAFACGAYLKKHRISKGHQVGKIDLNKSSGTS